MQPNNFPYNQTPPQAGAPQPVPGQDPSAMMPNPPVQQIMGVGPDPMALQQLQAAQQQAGVATPPAPAAVGSQDTTAKTATPKNPNSTQNTLQFSEIRDSMVIMSDGSFRVVIGCKSINFDLMSDREREGVEYSYQNFLNSLNFPIQILIRSQRVDIGPYIEKLVNERRSQDNMLLGVLMDDYINFIDALAQEANIMEKSFYIVIPYFPNADGGNLVEQSKGFFGKLFARPQNVTTHIDAATYQKAKDELKNRTDSVMAGLFQIGIQSVQLNTQQLGELYYSYYNPDTALRQPLGDFDNLATTFVKKAPNAPPAGGVQ